MERVIEPNVQVLFLTVQGDSDPVATGVTSISQDEQCDLNKVVPFIF